jgi:hypothetical protein
LGEVPLKLPVEKVNGSSTSPTLFAPTALANLEAPNFKVRILCVKNFKKEGSLLITGPGLSSYTETVTALPGWEPNAVLRWENGKYTKIMSYDKHPIGIILAPFGWITDKALLHHVNEAQFPDSEVAYWGSFMLQVAKSQSLLAMSGITESLTDVSNNLTGLLEIASTKDTDEERESKGTKALKYLIEDFKKEHAVLIGGGNLTQQITSINRAMDGLPQLRGESAWQDALANNFFFEEKYTDVKINQFGSEMYKKAPVFADFDHLSNYIVKPNDPNRSELENAVLSKPELHFPGFSMPESYKEIVQGLPESYTRDAKDEAGKRVNNLFIWNREKYFDNIKKEDLPPEEQAKFSVTKEQEKFIKNMRDNATEHTRVEMILKYYYDITGENLPKEKFIAKSKIYKDDSGSLESLSMAKLRDYFKANDIMIKDGTVKTQVRYHK